MTCPVLSHAWRREGRRISPKKVRLAWRERLINHVCGSAVYRINLDIRGSVIAPVEADDFDDEVERSRLALLRASGHRRSFADVPCRRLSVPLVQNLVVSGTTAGSHPLGIGHRRMT